MTAEIITATCLAIITIGSIVAAYLMWREIRHGPKDPDNLRGFVTQEKYDALVNMSAEEFGKFKATEAGLYLPSQHLGSGLWTHAYARDAVGDPMEAVYSRPDATVRDFTSEPEALRRELAELRKVLEEVKGDPPDNEYWYRAWIKAADDRIKHEALLRECLDEDCDVDDLEARIREAVYATEGRG